MLMESRSQQLFAFVARFVGVVVEDECCMRSDDSVQELFYMVDPELFRRIFFAAFNYLHPGLL